MTLFDKVKEMVRQHAEGECFKMLVRLPQWLSSTESGCDAGDVGSSPGLGEWQHCLWGGESFHISSLVTAVPQRSQSKLRVKIRKPDLKDTRGQQKEETPLSVLSQATAPGGILAPCFNSLPLA